MKPETKTETTREKLARLQKLHADITRLQQDEADLAADLATSAERGVRTAMARILGVSLEALRQRYGAVKSVADYTP